MNTKKHTYYQGLDIRSAEPVDERFYINSLTIEELKRVFGDDGRYGFEKAFIFNRELNAFQYLTEFVAKSDVLEISNWSKIDTSTDFQSTLENGNATSQSFYYLAEFPEGDNYKSGIFAIDGLAFPINASSMKFNNQSVTIGFATSANGGFIVKKEGTINSFLEFNLPNKPNSDYPESNTYTLATLDDLNASSVVIAISITKTEIDALISTNSLIVGALYEISGVHQTLYNDGLNSGTTIYLQAITNNKLASQGHGLFYNPKYDKVVSGFGIWNNRSSWLAMQNNSSILGITGTSPIGMVIDTFGNIYASNFGLNSVTKITPEGVSTILGTTGSNPIGITVDADGNVYTANTHSNNVSKITPSGVSTILGTTGSNPYGIIIDADGNVYTSNSTSNNVSKITSSGVSTILGTTGSNPYGIIIDADGNIYTANNGSNNVSKITPSGVSTILGVTEGNPDGIIIDADGNIYTANQASNNVSKITPSGVSTILGTTGESPRKITMDGDGNIYTANQASNNVSKITPSGVSTIFGTTGSNPLSIAIDSSNNIYTANVGSDNVSKITQIIQFEANELITANNGATGQLFQTLDWNTFIAFTGDWSSATSITGDVTGATANVTDIVLQSYTIDGKAIWGGYSWTNTTGNVGSSIDILNLDENWSKDVYDEVNYNKVFDLIEYDYENDWIYKRSNKDGINVEYSFDVKERLGKMYSSISTIQWGNGYMQNEDEIYFSFNNIVKNAYVEDVNFCGYGNYNNTYLQCSQSYNNVYCHNSYNYNNTYEQSSRNYDNTYGSGVYNNANTYQTESMNYGNVHGENSAIYRNIYGRGSHNYNNIYDTDSSNNDNDQMSSSHDNIYGRNSRFFNNMYAVGTLHYGNFYDENSSINNNIYSQSSYNYDNIYGKNAHHHENTYDQGSRNYGNTYDQNSLHHGNRYGKGSYCSNNTYGSFVYFKNIEIEQNVRLQNIIFAGSAILSSDYSKTIYRRPDGENRLRYYDNSDTLVIANITE